MIRKFHQKHRNGDSQSRFPVLFMPADQSRRVFCIWQHNCKAALKRILRTSELLLLFTFQGFQWVNGFTVNKDAQVQVRAGRPAGVAGFGNDLSLLDCISGFHKKF